MRVMAARTIQIKQCREFAAAVCQILTVMVTAFRIAMTTALLFVIHFS